MQNAMSFPSEILETSKSNRFVFNAQEQLNEMLMFSSKQYSSLFSILYSGDSGDFYHSLNPVLLSGSSSC